MINDIVCFLCPSLSLSLFLLYFQEKTANLSKEKNVKIFSLNAIISVVIFFAFFAFLYLTSYLMYQQIQNYKIFHLANIGKLIIGINLFIFMKMQNSKININLNTISDKQSQLETISLQIQAITERFSILFLDILFFWLNFSTIFLQQGAIRISFYNATILLMMPFVFVLSAGLFQFNYSLRIANSSNILKICFLLISILNGIFLQFYIPKPYQ